MSGTKVESDGIERIPHENMSFLVPVHDLLAREDVRRLGPRRFEVVSEDPVTVIVNGVTQIVMEKGTLFYSMTWEWERPLHACALDYSGKD